MSDNNLLDTRVGALERDFAAIRSDINALGSILADIKSTLSNSRPTWFVLAPIAISLAILLAGGVMAFGAVQAGVTRLDAIEQARDHQLSAVEHRLDRIEDRAWADKDHAAQ